MFISPGTCSRNYFWDKLPRQQGAFNHGPYGPCTEELSSKTSRPYGRYLYKCFCASLEGLDPLRLFRALVLVDQENSSLLLKTLHRCAQEPHGPSKHCLSVLRSKLGNICCNPSEHLTDHLSELFKKTASASTPLCMTSLWVTSL